MPSTRAHRCRKPWNSKCRESDVRPQQKQRWIRAAMPLRGSPDIEEQVLEPRPFAQQALRAGKIKEFVQGRRIFRDTMNPGIFPHEFFHFIYVVFEPREDRVMSQDGNF